jgi:hypothetical protein
MSAIQPSNGMGGAGRSPLPVPPNGNRQSPPLHQHDSLVAEAEALKALLRDACERVGRLLAALKRQRQQNRLLASTVNALRQLQQVDR